MLRRRLTAKKALNSHEQLDLLIGLEPIKPTRLMSVAELYDALDEKLIVDALEDRRVERKPPRYQPKQLGDYFAMWANTAPDGGIILVGVGDKGELIGCMSVSTNHVNDLERTGDVHCPDARHDCKHVKIINSAGKPDFVLAFHVKYREDRLVETVSGDALIRRGSSKKKLDADERRELSNAKGELPLELEPIGLKFPDDFDISLVRDFVESVSEQRHLSDDHSIEEVLELRRLGKLKDGVLIPNLACGLLFAKDPQLIVPGCKIRFLRFEGIEEKTGHDYNAIKSEWIEGTVPHLIERAATVVNSQLREFARLGADNHFYSVPEYPPEAWYEAIVNAAVHRSYAIRNMHIVIKMFDDRLVVESPGGFPPLVNAENIYETHSPRNPYLMEAMFYLRFVQCAHEGTRRIRDAMAKVGLPAPQFAQAESSNAFVRVTLRNDVEHRKEYVDTDAYLMLGQQLSESLSEFERRIVNFIAENGKINVTEAARVGNRRWQAAKKTLAALVKRGILDHVHSATVERDSNAYFTLKKRFSDKLKS